MFVVNGLANSAAMIPRFMKMPTCPVASRWDDVPRTRLETTTIAHHNGWKTNKADEHLVPLKVAPQTSPCGQAEQPESCGDPGDSPDRP